MTNYPENHQLKNELILHDSFLSSISINNISLNFIKQEEQIIECRLTFPVNLELYQRIDKDALSWIIHEEKNRSKKSEMNIKIDSV